MLFYRTDAFAGLLQTLTLCRFFAPSQDSEADVAGGFNASINNDGALDAYVETVLWRLRGTHAMVR